MGETVYEAVCQYLAESIGVDENELTDGLPEPEEVGIIESDEGIAPLTDWEGIKKLIERYLILAKKSDMDTTEIESTLSILSKYNVIGVVDEGYTYRQTVDTSTRIMRYLSADTDRYILGDRKAVYPCITLLEGVVAVVQIG